MLNIPNNLNECFEALDIILDDDVKKEIKNFTVRDIASSSHFGLGMWIRNNWQLWLDVPLKRYFDKRNITQPDEMSGLILGYYHQWLNNYHKEWQTFDKYGIMVENDDNSKN